MIVLEGPDGGGKTYLAAALHREFGLPIAPRVVAKDTTAMVDLVKWVEDNNNQPWQKAIFDRHRLISEPIYGTIMGRMSPGFDDLRWLANEMRKFYYKQPTIIYCIPDKETVYKNLVNDEDNRAIAPYWAQIYNAYVAKAASDFGKTSVYWHDYTHGSTESMLTLVRKELLNHG